MHPALPTSTRAAPACLLLLASPAAALAPHRPRRLPPAPSSRLRLPSPPPPPFDRATSFSRRQPLPPRRLLLPPLAPSSHRRPCQPLPPASTDDGRHGHVRDALLWHWKGRDPDTFPVYEYDLPSTTTTTGGNANADDRQHDYYAYMRRVPFCLCSSRHEVTSPRVVGAIHAGCVPVLVSDGYALPFADVLRWEAFSMSVPVANIPRLREVLERIPAPEVERLREGVLLVERHFTLHQPPERLDVFHTILHSV